jgi:hypothetical protein
VPTKKWDAIALALSGLRKLSENRYNYRHPYSILEVHNTISDSLLLDLTNEYSVLDGEISSLINLLWRVREFGLVVEHYPTASDLAGEIDRQVSLYLLALVLSIPSKPPVCQLSLFSKNENSRELLLFLAA